MTVAGYLAIGACLGAVTGMPIGAVGVAIIDAAHRHGRRRALAVAVGGGTGDTLFAGVGVLAVGPALASTPDALAMIYGLSGVALTAFGVTRLRARPRPPDRPARSRGRVGGFALGLALVVMNPASIVTWVVVVGGVTSGTGAVEGAALVTGIGLGSVAWFSCLAHLAQRGAERLGERAIWIPRVAASLLVGYGLFSLGRGAHYWLS